MGELFEARSIEAIARVLGDTEEGLTNSEIDNVIRACKFPEEEPGTKWFRIYNAMVKYQNRKQSRTGILEFMRQAMKPAFYLKNPQRFELLLNNLNLALRFDGMEMSSDGKIRKISRTHTIADAKMKADEFFGSLRQRDVHKDVLSFCREELLADNYFHAVLEATKSLAAKIRQKTGLTEDGASLVDKALCGKSPILVINDYHTESEQSEQKGFAMLCKGIFGTFRNPTAHAPRKDWEMTKKDAEDLMSLLSLVHRRLDRSKLFCL